MKKWNDRLREALKESPYKQRTLAQVVGVSTATMSQWVGGQIKNISAENAERVCATLRINTAWLMTGKGPKSGSAGDLTSEAVRKGKVPVISWIKAGALSQSPDTFQPGDAEEWIDCPLPHSKGSIYLRVIGDSMWPEYSEGEYILVDPEVAPTHGRDVVIRTPDDTYTFKRLQITPDGEYLLALNPDHPNRKIQVPPGTVICGVVTSSFKKR